MKRSVYPPFKTSSSTNFLTSSALFQSHVKYNLKYHLCETAPPLKNWVGVCVYVCVCLCESEHCPETVLLLNQSTALGPGSWAFCHILSLPTRPPAAHQEEEIRTIPSCHCSATRAHEEERA